MRSKDPELARKINDFIDHYYRDHHCVPTQQEVATALNVSQPTILRYLRSMDENKVLSYDGKVTETPEIRKCFTDYFSAPVVGS
ncbi:MAG: repressor LexA, partial [Oscillospiraceae bacterium]|nr:repressor LexA [Oscillospiraceae bacterium]